MRLSSEKCLQRVEPHLPELAVMIEPLRGIAKRLRIQTKAMLASDHRSFDQSGPLEDLDVFGDAIEGNREFIDDLADVCLAAGEFGQDGTARRIGDCSVDVIEVAFNHSVEYYHARFGGCVYGE